MDKRWTWDFPKNPKNMPQLGIEPRTQGFSELGIRVFERKINTFSPIEMLIKHKKCYDKWTQNGHRFFFISDYVEDEDEKTQGG